MERVVNLSVAFTLLFASLLAPGCSEGDVLVGRAVSAKDPAKQGATKSKSGDETLTPGAHKELEEIARRQSKALANAKSKVNRVFHFQQESGGEPNEEQKLVAVDIQFSGYQTDFDLDDVDIVDGETSKNYGSDPEIRLLRADGKLEQNESKWDTNTGALRVLLTYVVPKEMKSVQLQYWGQKITSEPTIIAEGKLEFPKGNLISGIEFWPYPRSYRFGDIRQQGRWLLVNLSIGQGTAVLDLHAWPPMIEHWDCNLLKGFERGPDSGWIVITRLGHSREDIGFAIWHHPEEKPGTSPRSNSATNAGEHLKDVLVVEGTAYTYDETSLYMFEEGELNRVPEIPAPVGVGGQFGPKYTHGSVALGNGKDLLVWDGDGYELVDGKFKKTWLLGIDEPYDFMTLPWGEDGFYYLQDREIFRARFGSKPEKVMTGVENVMGIHPGPEGSILFYLGDNDAGYVGGIWFPEDDNYIPFRPSELNSKLSSHDFDSVHWSDKTRRFYVVVRHGIFTIAGKQILNRQKQTLSL